MRKTSVYLSEEEVAGLRSLAHATGRSQAELIREGVRRVLDQQPLRHFRSMGKGATTGGRSPRWDADELARRLGVGGTPPAAP